MSLSKCLKQITTIDPADIAEIKRLTKQYRDQGVDRKTASVNAVETVMEGLLDERNAIVKQVINAGGIEEEMDLDEFLAKIEKEETINVGTTEQLGTPGQGTLEGIPATEIQGAERGGDTARVADRGTDADVQRDGRTDDAGRDRVGGVDADTGKISISVARERDVVPTNYKITAADKLGQGGAKTKYKSNVEAIRLLKELEAQARQATTDEQAVLVKYVGWGGIPQVFDAKNDKWTKEHSELKDLLTEEEYKAARRSTQDAHYTAKPVIDAMYKALMRLGFRGGRVLEPAVGTGNFLGLMSPTIKANSKVTGIELDHITGGIAKQLYPSYNIHAPLGYQEVSIPDGWFDAAIGNPPFGSQKIFDKAHKDLSKFSIHNYFFAKSVEKLRPGGVLAMVVSNSLMDSRANHARNWLAERTKLLGAIRLPNNAFKENAGTEVTTDIIFLQKKETDDLIKKGTRWGDVGTIKDEETGDDIQLNEYFIQNPGMMLGDMTLQGSMYRGGMPALVAPEGQNIATELAKAIENLPESVYKEKVKTEEELTNPDILVSKPEDIKIYGYGVDDSGKIVRRLPDVVGEAKFAEVEVTGKPLERMKGLIDIRGKLRKLMHEELNLTATDQELDNLRATLNRTYDNFVKKNGYIQGRANKLVFRDDTDYPLLSALEVDYDAGITAPTARKQGVPPRKASAKKADIFKKRVLKPYIPPVSADTAQDALMITLSEKGRVDIDRISELTGMQEAEILEDLSGVIYKDPDGDVVTADEYLSGNVKHKLNVAMEAAQKDDIYANNVKALELVQPEDVEAIDIDVRLGSPWIPGKDIQDFIKELINSDSTVRYEPSIGKWFASIPVSGNVESTSTWGTARAPASKLIPLALSGKTAAIYDVDSEGNRHLNGQETTAANSKMDEIQREFNDWIWRKEERRVRLHRYYNDTFNTNRLREYDGAHLTLPGTNPGIQLRDHQKNVIWRLIQEGKGLLDHVVGAGKTFAMIGAVMERKRMGLHNKPMVVVPNHLVGQWAADFMLLYPGAKVLLASKKDFEKKNRQLLFSRIATGDWDAVVIAHSSFEKIPMPGEEEKAFLEQQVSEISTAIETAKIEEGGRSPSIKELEKMKERLETKMQAAQGSKEKDDVVDFSEIGVDALYLDEAHEFKNLFFTTSKTRVAGLGDPKGSQKAFDMFVKTQYIQRINNGNGVVFATGTPISNTVAEMFTVQRYLQYQELKDRGLHHFDSWANVFGAIVTDWELDATGVNYKMNSRFAKFVNVPELMTMYQGVADVITMDNLKDTAKAQGKRWPVPKITGGEPQNHVVERSPDQAAYMDTIIQRAQDVSQSKDKKDNMLVITNDARKMALDMRLVDPAADDHPASKINAAVDKIKTTYDVWDEKKGVQLVFIDLSTPKKAKGSATAKAAELQAKANEGDEKAAAALGRISMDELLADQGNFSVYDDIKTKLIGKGIPENKIAFIHDANTELQKEKLFDKVNRGEIRVLLGSTAKMGAGMNVQKKLVALHHLDAPWRPSDLEQREGRIIRQGNEFYEADPENFEIEILRYATKQTYDARMWQTLEIKARFISQLRKGDSGQRTVEDIGGQAASFADLKAAATGNPLILEQVKLASEIRKLDSLKINHQRSLHRMQDTVSRLEDSDEKADSAIADLKEDIKIRDANVLDKTNFTITINHGKPITDKTKAGKELFKHIADFTKKSTIGQTYDLANYRGFKVTLMRNADSVNLLVHGKSGKHKSSYGKGDEISASGVLTRINNILDKFDDKVKYTEAQKARDAEDYKSAKESLTAPFKQEKEYQKALEQQKNVIAELERLKNPKYPGMDIEDVLAGKEPPEIPEDAPPTISEQIDAGAKPYGLPVNEVEEIAFNIIKDWKKKPKFTVVDKASNVPEKYFEQVYAMNQDKIVRAFIDDTTGEVFVIAENIETPAQLERAVFHEILGHRGLRSMLGAGFEPLMRKVWTSFQGTKDMQAVLKNYKGKYDPKKPADQLKLAEELMARMAEQVNKNTLPQRLKNLWSQLVAYLRDAFRKFGINLALSDADITNILIKAATHVRKGTAAEQKAAPIKDDISFMAEDEGRETYFDRKWYTRPQMWAEENLPFKKGKIKNIGMWSKTVGSMYHMGMKEPTFKKVFDTGQAYLNDVSRLAMESEQKAQGLFYRMDSVKQAVQQVFTPEKAGVAKDEDTQAISVPIYRGTLVDQKTYEDAELRDRFNLTDKQITLYHQTIAATQKTLDETTKASMYRYAKALGVDGEVLHAIRNQSDDSTEFLQIVYQHSLKPAREALKEEVAMVKAALDDAPEDLKTEFQAQYDAKKAEFDSLESGIAELYKMQARAKQLIKEGYFPLMRFGKYYVDVSYVDEMTGKREREAFLMFENVVDAREAAAELAAEYPDSDVGSGVMSQEQHKLFQGLSPDTVELFAKQTGMDQTQAFQDYIKLAVSNRSAMKRLIKRKKTPGFSKDINRTLASFIMQNSRLSASHYHLGDMVQAIDKIPADKGDIKDVAVKLRDYLINPTEEFSKLRNFMFFQFLGGSISSALVNLTQVPMATFPYLSQWGAAQAATALGKWAKPGTRMIDDQHAADLRRAEEEGIVSPQEVYNLMATARGQQIPIFKGRKTQAALFMWGSMFSAAEQYNRRVTFNAAYDVARKQGETDAYAFAVKAVDETQFIYNRGNRPQWARGIGAPIFTFKQFMINYLEMLTRLPKRQQALALAMIILAAGLEGLPFAEDIEDILDTIMQWAGYNWNTRAEMIEWAKDTFGEQAGDVIAEVSLRGITSVIPLDIQGRLSFGNIIPGTAALKPSETQKGAEAWEVLGVSTSVAKSVGYGTADIFKGNVGKGLYTMSPKAVKDVVKGVEMMTTGKYRDNRGKLTTEVEPIDAILKGIGFHPSRVSAVQREQRSQQQLIGLHAIMKTAISDKLARGVAFKDKAEIAEAKADLKRWNQKNPEYPIALSQQGIKQRVMQFMLPSELRLLKRTPPEIRKKVYESIK